MSKTMLATLALAATAVLPLAPAWAGSDADVAREILTLERQALDGWLRGDPGPQLAISDPQITYIHSVVEKRLDGAPAVQKLYDAYRGRPLFDSYEIVEPKVRTSAKVAVLTYRLARHTGAATSYWNATQVYEKQRAGWRVIHSHWSKVEERQR